MENSINVAVIKILSCRQKNLLLYMIGLCVMLEQSTYCTNNDYISFKF